MDNLCEPLKGFADIYGHEKRIIEYLKWKLAEFFQLWGYEILEMPLVEKCTSFSEEIVGYSPWPEWDKKGCFYVKVDNYVHNYTEPPLEKEALLIPEGTISVTRWIAGQLSENIKNILPLKIFYITPCFRNELINKLSETKKRQFDQVGLEIIGIQSRNADIETILLIVKGLEYIGFIPQNIIIRLSDIEVFNRLADRCQLRPMDRVTIKEFLDKIAEKRVISDQNSENKIREHLAQFLDKLPLSRDFKEFWLLLSEVDGLKSLPSDFSQPTLSYIEKLCYELKHTFNVNAQIDSSVVRSHEYYSGTVFEVDYLQKEWIYVEIAGGGRYNKLVNRFTTGQIQDIPATGFAYGVQRLVPIWKTLNPKKVIENVNFFLEESSDDGIILSKNNNYYNAYVEAEKIRKSGKRISVWLGDYNKSITETYPNVIEVE